MATIPREITELIVLATSGDALTKREAKDRLVEVRDYINTVLGEADTCARCGRALVVSQHLDYVDLPEGKVCIPCVEGKVTAKQP